MSPDWLPTILFIQSVITGVASVFVWVLGRERKTLEDRMVALERRLDGASSKSSMLTGIIQTLISRVDRMPEELRDKFWSVEQGRDLKDDQQAIWIEISKIRDGNRRGGHNAR